MITDKHLPSILDVINESAPTAKVLLNVVKKDDHLLYPETIKQINPNVQLFFKFNLFTPFSIQYCDISLKECYIHPSVINSPIIIYPQKNLNVSKIEEVCQLKFPNVQLQKLIVKGFLPNAVYSNDKLKCLNELEISEKTEKMSSTEEYYFGKFSQLTCLKVGDDALESSTKTRKCTLPYSLKQLYLRQGFVNIRDGVEVNNVNGIQHLNKLTFLTLEPYLDSFDNVQFPKSLIDIRFNRAPQFKDMSQFHQLTNLTHVVLNDCESLITPILPESVIELKLSYCTNVKSLDISHLSNLTLLELGQYNDTDIKLPTYLSELSIAQSQKFISLDLSYVKIKDITIDRCEKLVEVTLPTSLEVATIKDCDELNRIDLSKMKQLEDLVLEMLPLLKSLLLSSNIKVLSVGDLEILDSIENMSFFKNLVEVSVIGCPCIKTLTLPSQLQQLDLNDNSDLVTLNKGDLRNCKCTILDCPNLGDDY
ncbi:Leucine-rich repeat containing protein [Entamoeba marina]